MSFNDFILSLVILQSLVVLVNLITFPWLENTKSKYSNSISILIPARNEEFSLPNLLESLTKLDYENFEVIILDDDSTDKTSEIVDTYLKKYPNFKKINGDPLPSDWHGKNWACHQLAQAAKGEYLLFLDADTRVSSNNILNNVLAFSQAKKLDLFSIFTDQIMLSRGEKIVVPFINQIILTLLPLVFIRILFFPSMAAASGQFMLFKSSTYKKHNWHEQVKSEIAEDISIIRLMKKKHYRTATLLSNGNITCRMYTNLSDCIKGFEKNILIIFGNSYLFALGYLVLILWGWIFLLAEKQYFYLGIFVLLSLVNRIISSWISKQSIYENLIYYPLNTLIISYIMITALYKKVTRKSVIWKDRKILVK